MYFEKITKERFVKMLDAGDIIVIECDKSANRKTYDYKFIGANSEGYWDFTPLCADLSDYPNNGRKCVQRLSIRSNDGVAVLCDVIEKLDSEGIFFSDKKGHDLYEIVRHLVTMCYI